jgi:ferredoxin
VRTAAGFIEVNDIYQTADPKVFAIGDAVKLGLLTDAIGAGRKAAQAITEIVAGKEPLADSLQMIDRSRIKLEYFDPRRQDLETIEDWAAECSSCGSCRDCEVCISICPQAAISKKEDGQDDFEMVVDEDKCIGCGFCAGACPCGIWTLVENEPMG